MSEKNKLSPVPLIRVKDIRNKFEQLERNKVAIKPLIKHQRIYMQHLFQFENSMNDKDNNKKYQQILVRRQNKSPKEEKQNENISNRPKAPVRLKKLSGQYDIENKNESSNNRYSFNIELENKLTEDFKLNSNTSNTDQKKLEEVEGHERSSSSSNSYLLKDGANTSPEYHRIIVRAGKPKNPNNDVQHLVVKRDALSKPSVPSKPTTPVPPKKPPRTHFHDQYLETKNLRKSLIEDNVDVINSVEDLKPSVRSADGSYSEVKHDNENRFMVYDSVPSDKMVQDSNKSRSNIEFKLSKGYQKVKPCLAKQMESSNNSVPSRRSINRRAPVSDRNKPHKPLRPPPPRPIKITQSCEIENPLHDLQSGFSDDFVLNPFYETKETSNKTCERQDSLDVDMNDNYSNEHRRNFSVLRQLFDNTTSQLNPNTESQVLKSKSRQPANIGPVNSLHSRCCSDEVVYSKGLNEASPIYTDPIDVCHSKVTSLDDSYASPEIQVIMDEEGYAIPFRFKKNLSQRLSDNPFLSEKEKISKQLLSILNGAPNLKEVSEIETPKSRKRNLNLVKHKINTAFSAFRSYVRKRPSVSSDSFESSQDTTTENDSLVDEKEIRNRLNYVSSVRDRTKSRVVHSNQFINKIYPQFFECALIVGIKHAKVGTLPWEPEILYKFPEMVNINETIPQFCFPDCEFLNPRSSSKKSETYSFVLTNEDGCHVFGYCRRYTVYNLGWKTLEVICILSPLNSFNIYKLLLDEIEKRRLISLDQAQEMIASAFGRPMPSPGKSVQIRCMSQEGEVESISLSRNVDTRLENVDYDLLFSVLGVDKLIRTFSAMLLERRLLFTSTKISLLTATIHGLVSLLYPFTWQHTYIPVLPPQLLETTCAPTPYIMGILHSELDKVSQLPTEEILIVDLDTKSLLQSMGDENTIIPKKLYKALKSALNLCRFDAEAERSKNLMISEAFIRLFVEIVGHYGDFISTQQNGVSVFQKEQFVHGAKSESFCQFLSWFVGTQMFDIFISERTTSQSSDLFATRVAEYKDGTEGQKLSKKFGKKFFNIGKAFKAK